MTLPIDHIVFAFPELKMGVDYIKKTLGVNPVYGGQHHNFGTHNALIGLGPKMYLEIIAPDPNNKKVKSPRWMGVDLLGENGRITRVALKTKNIQQDLNLISKINPNYAQSGSGSRKTASGKLLSWQMSYPLSHPLIDPVPFLVQWVPGYHPADTIQQGYQFAHLDIFYDGDLSKLNNIYNQDQVSLYPSKTSEIQLYIKREETEIMLKL